LDFISGERAEREDWADIMKKITNTSKKKILLTDFPNNPIDFETFVEAIRESDSDVVLSVVIILHRYSLECLSISRERLDEVVRLGYIRTV
jgi:hypothetical protein